MSDDLVKQLEKAMEQSEQREAQLNDRVSALEDILYLTEANLESAEQQGYASAMEAERKRHEARIKELEAKLAKAVEGLEELARLGNGDRYGNSYGNMIAREYLAELTGGKDV